MMTMMMMMMMMIEFHVDIFIHYTSNEEIHKLMELKQQVYTPIVRLVAGLDLL